jgi:hypothetical protein
MSVNDRVYRLFPYNYGVTCHRHGFSAVASLAGPTYAQIDTLMDILHGEGDSAVGELLGQEGGHKGQHPWRSRATELMKLTRDNNHS